MLLRFLLVPVMAGVSWAQTNSSSDDVITEDSYFYGESPPIYPSPNMTGLGSWEEAYSKAKALVSQMTLEEKINLTAGYTPPNGCSGIIPAIPRLGFPGMCLSDGASGVRGTDFVTSWPSGMHVGASWNKELAYKRGAAMGREFKRKGVNVMLGPVVCPLGRVVEGGRNWEGFSSDPYLSGSLVSETVGGTQGSGVISSTKHFIGNEQETYRYSMGNISSVSSNIDDTTLHELYLWPFQDAVHAGTGNIMCAYNRVNNSYSCQNSKLLNGVLKEELGFQGFVVSDWDALHAGYNAALAGLDMAMPDSAGFWASNLTESVKNGSVSEGRIDDMVTRIVSSWYQMGQDRGFPSPGVGMPSTLLSAHEIVDARDPDGCSTAFQGAVEGHVLVKNMNNALPLQKPRMLSIVGYSARAPDQVMPTPGDLTPWTFGFESALVDIPAVIAYYEGQIMKASQIAPNGTLVTGGGSGTTSQSTIIAPFDALLQRAAADKTQLYWDFSSSIPYILPNSDACLVFGNAFASEGMDRWGIHDDYTDTLILSVAEQCANTIVVLHNAGIRLVEKWIEHPNVTAAIFAHLPGQESGNALVSLLYGESQFSGKLPYTVAKNESDYGGLLSPAEPEGRFEYFPQSNFTEGVYVDYRYFDRNDIQPRFEFGFGLGYSSFEYSALTIYTVQTNATGRKPYPTGPLMLGGHTDLWDVLTRVTADISNNGTVSSSEVAQLYLGIPGAPERQLRGFEKPFISAGHTTTVAFELTRRDLSVWDVVAQKWRLQEGLYQVYVGSSSRQLPLIGNFSLCMHNNSTGIIA